MAEFMDGEATIEDGVALIAAAIKNHLPSDGSAFVKDDETGEYRTKTNPVNWMLDLAIAIVAVERACGIDKKHTRKMLAMVRERIDMEGGQEMLQQAVAQAQLDIFERVRPAIEEARDAEAEKTGVPKPEGN